MRIVFIVDSFPSVSETFVLNQITGLMDLGHEVVIFAASQPHERDFHADIQKYDLLKNVYFYNEKPVNKFVRFAEAIFLLMFNFYRNPRAFLNSLNIFKYGREAFSLTLFYKVFLFVCMGPFDIIQCHFGTNGNIAVLMKEVGIRGEIVTMFHGYDIRLGICRGGAIYKKLFEYGSCLLSISKYNYENLIKFGADPQKIVTHPVGINLNRFPLKVQSRAIQDKRQVKIITIARFVKEKGLLDGIRAVKRLVDLSRNYSIKYQIVGDGPLRNDLVRVIDDLEMCNNIHLIGSENQVGVNSLLQNSDIFFLPSIAEALPVVLMEAQAVGLPVLATDVGSVSQVVLDGKSGFVVPTKNIDAMVEKLKYLIEHRKQWEQMGLAGYQHIKEYYDIEKLNRRLVEIYEKLQDLQTKTERNY